jgi:glycogen(starch) synthase
VLRPARPVDVVHAHQGEDLVLLPLALVAARIHRCPLVVTVHCSARHTVAGRSAKARLLRAAGGRIESWTLRRADAVVTLADRTRLLLARDGVPTARLHLVPSGFEPDLFESEQADAFPDVPQPRVGYLGRLARQKRPDLLLHAFARMAQPAHLVVVGDGPDAARVRRLAARSPARDRIVRRGFVPHAQVPAVLASLDVLVLPSAYEELGSVLIEAMAAGLPVVATRVGGIPEVVADGETGLLVPPGDAPALAAAVDRLLADPALAKRLGASARSRAAAWSWPELAGRVAAIYDDCLRAASRS